MKTKYWVAIFAVVLILCAGLTWWAFGRNIPARSIEIWVAGELRYTLPLAQDRTITIESEKGINRVEIRSGAVAVTYADCPDGYCVKRGFCSGGAQIVCLPHEMVIKFTGKQALDGTVG